MFVPALPRSFSILAGHMAPAYFTQSSSGNDATYVRCGGRREPGITECSA